MLCSHCLSICRLLWTRVWRKGLLSSTSQLHLIGLVTADLHKLRSIGVGGQFLFIVSEFLSDKKAERAFGW